MRGCYVYISGWKQAFPSDVKPTFIMVVTSIIEIGIVKYAIVIFS